MTREEWDNLKPGDKLVCRYMENENNYREKRATFICFANGCGIKVSWDDKLPFDPFPVWYCSSSFDLIKNEFDLLNGGAAC